MSYRRISDVDSSFQRRGRHGKSHVRLEALESWEQSRRQPTQPAVDPPEARERFEQRYLHQLQRGRDVSVERERKRRDNERREAERQKREFSESLDRLKIETERQKHKFSEGLSRHEIEAWKYNVIPEDDRTQSQPDYGQSPPLRPEPESIPPREQGAINTRHTGNGRGGRAQYQDTFVDDDSDFSVIARCDESLLDLPPTRLQPKPHQHEHSSSSQPAPQQYQDLPPSWQAALRQSQSHYPKQQSIPPGGQRAAKTQRTSNERSERAPYQATCNDYESDNIETDYPPIRLQPNLRHHQPEIHQYQSDPRQDQPPPSREQHSYNQYQSSHFREQPDHHQYQPPPTREQPNYHQFQPPSTRAEPDYYQYQPPSPRVQFDDRQHEPIPTQAELHALRYQAYRSQQQSVPPKSHFFTDVRQTNNARNTRPEYQRPVFDSDSDECVLGSDDGTRSFDLPRVSRTRHVDFA